MYELRRHKRYGFVSLGKFFTLEQALRTLCNCSSVVTCNHVSRVYHCADGYTYEVVYA